VVEVVVLELQVEIEMQILVVLVEVGDIIHHKPELEEVVQLIKDMLVPILQTLLLMVIQEEVEVLDK
jgi:hypothetical protein